MIRKTRLLSKAGLMLIRVEVFEDDVLRATHLKLNTPAGSRTFTTMTAAIKAFRAASLNPVETARLKTAA